MNDPQRSEDAQLERLERRFLAMSPEKQIRLYTALCWATDPDHLSSRDSKQRGDADPVLNASAQEKEQRITALISLNTRRLAAIEGLRAGLGIPEHAAWIRALQRSAAPPRGAGVNTSSSRPADRLHRRAQDRQDYQELVRQELRERYAPLQRQLEQRAQATERLDREARTERLASRIKTLSERAPARSVRLARKSDFNRPFTYCGKLRLGQDEVLIARSTRGEHVAFDARRCNFDGLAVKRGDSIAFASNYRVYEGARARAYSTRISR